MLFEHFFCVLYECFRCFGKGLCFLPYEQGTGFQLRGQRNISETVASSQFLWSKSSYLLIMLSGVFCALACACRKFLCLSQPCCIFVANKYSFLHFIASSFFMCPSGALFPYSWQNIFYYMPVICPFIWVLLLNRYVFSLHKGSDFSLHMNFHTQIAVPITGRKDSGVQAGLHV